MCGIAGFLDTRGAARRGRSDLERMIRSLHHRGPDGTGFLVDGPAGLAHARLSIIDLASGDQPIPNEDRSVWVVFNGEIFNYIELRADLIRRGHVFRTQSDTETIVHAYEEYGESFVGHLNGQFAIALWDTRKQLLLLARDRVGIRPLFYMNHRGALLFASEIKALQAATQASLTFDMRGIAEVFTFWSALGERTVFSGVRSLPAGHLMSIDAQGARLTRYWDWSDQRHVVDAAQSFEEAAERVRAALVDAVRLQLRADVPVGAYLSGGLDSSAIAAIVRKCTATPLHTFSLAFADAEFDESEHQRQMAAYLGTKHETIHCKRRDIGALFPSFIRHAEVPVLRTAPVPLMLLSALVRRAGYKVVLTGEGADELFGGYDLFKEAKIRRFWARQPGSKARAALLTRLYPYLKHSPVASAAYAESFFGKGLADAAHPFYAHLPRWNTTQRLWMFFARELREEMADEDPVQWAAEALSPPQSSAWESLGRDQYTEVHTLLGGYLLSSQGDRVAMANSIEGRFPFLDHHLIELVNGLPARFKLRGLREKAVLRRAVADLLPDSILQRVKQPYRAPDSQSFFEEGAPLDYVAEILEPGRLRAAGIFDSDAVVRLVEKCRSGRAIGFADNMAFVGILSVMLLAQEFVDQTPVDGKDVRVVA